VIGRQNVAMTGIAVRRVDFGYFVRPATETGIGVPQVEPVLGYVVTHPNATLLFDTGMGSHPVVDARYLPRRTPLPAALTSTGLTVDDITHVVNCHLHFDHCGGNPAFAGRPIYAQRVELATARTAANYTLPELIDTPGTTFEELDGEAEVLPGVHVIPTPGHTDGHQSLLVRSRDGTIVVAGQSHNTATSYGADVLAWRARDDHHSMPAILVPDWIEILHRFDPRQVLFAHDHSVWRPSDAVWAV